jgi:hypothetical protein
MNKKRIGAALLLVLLVAVVSVFALHLNPFSMAVYSGLGLGMIGLAVAYADPVSGANPPSAAVASASQSLTATVTFADGDTQAVVTHNWGLTTAQLNKLRPWVHHYYTTSPTVFAQLAFALSTNAVTINKGSTATGSGGTLNVVIQRPWSPMTTIDAR